MTISEKKEALLTDGTRFTYKTLDQVFTISRYTDRGEDDDATYGLSVRKDETYSFDGMNIESLGSKRLKLYTYTILGKKVEQYLQLEDITILEDRCTCKPGQPYNTYPTADKDYLGLKQFLLDEEPEWANLY